MINTKLLLLLSAVSVAVVGLAGCVGSSHSGGSVPQSPSGSSSSAADSGALSTASTTLGTVVVDSKGMTVYIFDNDKANSGKSSCSGDCLSNWPIVQTTSATPAVSGVTGTVGTITRTDGAKQVTLNGLPLYTYAGDKAAGDTNGQAVGRIWWLVSPAGEKITREAKSGY
jgi:predicted lipoprotein with Yx(FWY)xxD motif